MVNKRNPAESRRKILEAAQQEIHSHGFRSASLNRILASTGLTKGAFYHHFPNKQALGRALIGEVMAKMVDEEWIAPLEREGDPIDQLCRILSGFAAREDLRSVLLGCLLNNLAQEMSSEDEELRLRIKEIYDRWRGTLAQALERGRKNGQVREGPDLEAVAAFIVAGLAGCRSLAKNAQDPEILKQCAQAMVGYWESLRA